MNESNSIYGVVRKHVAADMATKEIEDLTDPNVYKSEFKLRNKDYVIYKQNGIEYVCEKGTFTSIRLSEWVASMCDDDIMALIALGRESMLSELMKPVVDLLPLLPSDWDERCARIERKEMITAVITWSILATIIAGIGYGIDLLIF